MAYVTKNGLSAIVYEGEKGTLVTTGTLNANAWYEVNAKGSSSALPAYAEEGTVFKTPDTSATAITLASGDEVYPLTLTQICKTDATIECEEGVLDVTDDCGNGSTEKILDGFVEIKGTLGGFLKYDADTGEIKDQSKALLKRFFDYVTDDGQGTYAKTAKSNDVMILLICLNKDAEVGDKQNWLITPAILYSLSTGAALKDPQKRDLNWEKGQGLAYVYERTVFADDVIS